MATLSQTASGRRVIQFPAVIGKGRRTISLGSIDKPTAEIIRSHVAELVKSAVNLTPADDLAHLESQIAISKERNPC